MSESRVAFLLEAEEWMLDGYEEPEEPSPDRWLTGLFLGHVEHPRADGADLGEETRPLPVAEAVAWATARADGVVIRDGDGRQWGLGAVLEAPGAEDADDDGSPLRPWRPEFAPELVRRRPADERWKDRTAEDPPIAWVVEALLGPAGAIGEVSRITGDVAAVDAEAAATIARWAPDSSSAEAVERYRVESRRARRRARLRRHSAYFVHGDPRWSLLWSVTAPTAALALAPLRTRLQPPAGWEVELRAVPADLHRPRDVGAPYDLYR